MHRGPARDPEGRRLPEGAATGLSPAACANGIRPGRPGRRRPSPASRARGSAGVASTVTLPDRTTNVTELNSDDPGATRSPWKIAVWPSAETDPDQLPVSENASMKLASPETICSVNRFHVLPVSLTALP